MNAWGIPGAEAIVRKAIEASDPEAIWPLFGIERPDDLKLFRSPVGASV